MLHLSWAEETIPDSWRKVPIAPVVKPGKDGAKAESYRPISLMAAGLKHFDKLLANRIWPRSKQHIGYWQGGGMVGADEMAWNLHEILASRQRNGKKHS